MAATVETNSPTVLIGGLTLPAKADTAQSLMVAHAWTGERKLRAKVARKLRKLYGGDLPRAMYDDCMSQPTPKKALGRFVQLNPGDWAGAMAPAPNVFPDLEKKGQRYFYRNGVRVYLKPKS